MSILGKLKVAVKFICVYYYRIMKILTVFIFITAIFAVDILASKCAEDAKEISPELSKETGFEYSLNLEIAARNFGDEPTADNIIWYARRKGYLGHYKDVIESLTIALEKYDFKSDARIYRHRGHRYLTLRCFDDAIKDFETAAKLIKGKPDEVEPDGLPNAQNKPTSTLQSNIWYHLGLAYYLKGDYKKALAAYKECQKVSKNNDMRVATSYWHYLTLRRMGKNKDAEKLLKPFAGNIKVIENRDCLNLIKLYRGEAKAEDLLATIRSEADTLGSASLGYGIGAYFLINGDKEKAATIFSKITAGNQWASFGYIAAKRELHLHNPLRLVELQKF